MKHLEFLANNCKESIVSGVPEKADEVALHLPLSDVGKVSDSEGLVSNAGRE